MLDPATDAIVHAIKVLFRIGRDLPMTIDVFNVNVVGELKLRLEGVSFCALAIEAIEVTRSGFRVLVHTT